jgi:NAD(P)-dependent dehydrogenase (short-subunit alcohol dehydrogenase family)
MQTNQAIWLITGISSGLGKAIAQAVIDKGDFVIGTFRNQTEVDTFNQKNQGKALALKLDLTSNEDINQAVQHIEQQFGQLDFLVNNAGLGFAGAIEETSEQEARALFEANFFGTLQMTKATLPLFRARKKGHIFQISSHGGFKAFAGFGIYNATKFAVEGFSEALAAEVNPLGIKVTIVEPGPFRTGFAGSRFAIAAQHIEDYQTTAGVFKERIKGIDGKQEGDPDKAAQAILQIAEENNPPLRLILGKVAMGTISSKLESVQKDLSTWSALSESVVF